MAAGMDFCPNGLGVLVVQQRPIGLRAPQSRMGPADPEAMVDPSGSGADSSRSRMGPKTRELDGFAKSMLAPDGSRSATAIDIAVAFGPVNQGNRGLS